MKGWRQWHRWLALIVGIQVLLWISGGLYMSAMPLNLVHGNHLIKPHQPSEYVLPSGQLSINAIDYHAMEWSQQGNIVRLIATEQNGKQQVFEVVNGALVQANVLSEDEIRQIAESRYTGEEPITSLELLTQPPFEASNVNGPVFKVMFDDWSNATFYIHPITGAILKVRSDIWRLFDIFWMLHIMDYDERSDFNNPLLIIAAVIALLFSMGGMVLTGHWLKVKFQKRR